MCDAFSVGKLAILCGPLRLRGLTSSPPISHGADSSLLVTRDCVPTHLQLESPDSTSLKKKTAKAQGLLLSHSIVGRSFLRLGFSSTPPQHNQEITAKSAKNTQRTPKNTLRAHGASLATFAVRLSIRTCALKRFGTQARSRVFAVDGSYGWGVTAQLHRASAVTPSASQRRTTTAANCKPCPYTNALVIL